MKDEEEITITLKGRKQYTLTTHAGGNVTFTDIPDDTYKLTVTSEGYEDYKGEVVFNHHSKKKHVNIPLLRKPDYEPAGGVVDVEFTVYRLSMKSMRKKKLKGAEITLKSEHYEETVTGVGTNVITFTEVPYGEYTYTARSNNDDYPDDVEGWITLDESIGDMAAVEFTFYPSGYEEESEDTSDDTSDGDDDDGEDPEPEGEGPEPVESRTINVIVRDSDSKETLPGANIILVSNDENYLEQAITDSEGEATFTEVPFGTYGITVILEGYDEYSDSLLINSNNNEPRIYYAELVKE